MRRICMVLGIVLVCILNVSTVLAANKVYTMSQACRTEPRLTLKKVTITQDETILDMEYIETMTDQNIGVYPPGHDMAFFITDVSNAKKYNLLDIEGIAMRPNVNHLNPGDKVNFKLTFEKIPIKRFHLVEGKLPSATSITWHFTNIKLQ